MPRNQGHGDDSPTRGFHFLAADDLISRQVAALHQNIRKELRDNFAGIEVLKNDHAIDAFQGRENLSAFAFGQHRAASAFELTHTRVAVQADDECIAQRAGLLKAADVAGMQKIEAAIGENDAATVAFIAAKPQNRFLQSKDRRGQGISMQARMNGNDVPVEELVYHAPATQRLATRRAP
jgi:hypothetical protein